VERIQAVFEETDMLAPAPRGEGAATRYGATSGRRLWRRWRISIREISTNILGGSQFGYRLLWVLLWSNVMAILIQYLAASWGL
jgi:hypothetical protein